MKLLAALILLLALPATPVLAQTTLTNYYTILPVNGCDGLAAFGPASDIWQLPCSAPYLYLAQPDGCAQGPTPFGQPVWFSGDTMYTTLCSMPCGITIYDSSGDCVILCQLPGPTGVAEGPGQLEALLMANPIAAGTTLEVSALDLAPTMLILMDVQGRMVERIPMASSMHATGSARLNAGIYLLHAWWPSGGTTTQRLIVQ